MRRALAFLTVAGGSAAPTPSSVGWFGAVGAMVGLVVGGAWWLAAELWPPLVAAVLVVAVDLAITGMLHLDGLADSADGLLPPVDRPRRLEIMADPVIGAFGATAVAVTLLLRVAGLAALAPEPLLVAGLWCASRTLMAVALVAMPYARGPQGLAAAFTDGRNRGRVVAVAGLVGLGLAAPLVALASGWAGGAALAAGLVGGGLVLWLAQRRLGGYTGDVLGAAGVVAETVGLVVAGARW